MMLVGHQNAYILTWEGTWGKAHGKEINPVFLVINAMKTKRKFALNSVEKYMRPDTVYI